jgi:hypothetical protein
MKVSNLKYAFGNTCFLKYGLYKNEPMVREVGKRK